MADYHVLGMMSGTSLDGLDIAHCQFWQDGGHWLFKIHEATTISYSNALHKQLANAIHLSENDHWQLHLEYGKWLGNQAKDFMAQKNLKIDFIASHGHTSHHRPKERVTFQLGDGQEIANTSQTKVICDFRTRDVELGGQGAPLVPIGDELLFHDFDFCLNLGGISNISFKTAGQRYAFDVGMANMPLNHITQKIGLAYDEDGQLAASGQLIPELYEVLNQLGYYQLPYPKSTGLEWFSENVQPLIDASKKPVEDVLHTLIHHNCEQIRSTVESQTPKKDIKLLATGGGALNGFFISLLQEKLGGFCEVVIPEEKIINYKEALVFALMGVLKVKGEINIFSSVTGANSDSSSGAIHLPQ